MNGLNERLAIRRWKAMAATFAAAALVAACGGGGGDNVGTGGTGTGVTSYAAGRIAGFGSIIVNGVRFDDSTATVTDDDGTGHGSDDLKLGMVVEVVGGAVSTDTVAGTSTATATSIVFSSELKGQVDSVDATAGTLIVIGQAVNVDAATVFDGFAGGLAGVQAGDLVEIYAFFDATAGTYHATRIERKEALDEYKLHGVVTGLDATAQTFMVGGITIDHSGIAGDDLPALSNGLSVRVKLQPVPQAGVWMATQVRTAVRTIEDEAEAEIEGVVTDFTSLATFKVNGIAVDASGTGVVFEDGTSANVVDGVRIEVEGTMQDGVLVARRVELEQEGDNGQDTEVEFHGDVESVDAGSASFVVHGITITFDDNTRFDDGTAAALVVGATVEVRGTLADGGASVVATRIKFED